MRSSIAVAVPLLALSVLLTVVARPQEGIPSDDKNVTVDNENNTELAGLSFQYGGGGCQTCGQPPTSKPCSSCGQNNCGSDPVYVYLVKHSRRRCGCKHSGQTCSSNSQKPGGCPYCQKPGGEPSSCGCSS